MVFNGHLEKFSRKISKWAGSTTAFILAVLLIVIWGCLGPYYKWSDSHSLFINSITTIITFLMVFLLQRQQNKDSTAIQLKLNELIASTKGASNRLLNIEDFPEAEIESMRDRYRNLTVKMAEDKDCSAKHSVEEIEQTPSSSA